MRTLALPLLLSLTVAAHAATPAPKPAAAKPAPAKPAPAPQAPITPEALLEQSRDAQAKGDGDLALRLAQAAIVADPAQPGSYVALGNLYAVAGQSEFARSYYDAALEIDPADAGATAAIAAQGAAKATAAK